MKLKQFTINSGGKFTPQAPIVVDFLKSKIAGGIGDEKAGKSTLIDLFLVTIGQLGGQEVIDALTNKETGQLETGLTFQHDRADYEVRNKNGRLTLKKEGEATKGGPQELLKQMVGVAGVSPMAYKTADIDDTIKWLASYSTKGVDEFQKQMLKNKEGQKVAKKERADANREAKAIRVTLRGAGVIDDSDEFVESIYSANEKKYSKKVDINDLSKKLDAAGKKSDKYVENETKIEGQKTRKEQINQQIKLLQKELAQVEENISIGEKWLSENADAKKSYDAIKKQYDTAAQDSLAFENWQKVKRDKAKMDEWQEKAQVADNKEKELVKKQQELQWEVIPDIKGVELLLDDEYDDGQLVRKAGFYKNKMSSRQMSATEWLTVCIQILKKNKCRIIVIDDISQFGSSLIELLKKLVDDNCYVLYTEMSRGQEVLEIEYKID